MNVPPCQIVHYLAVSNFLNNKTSVSAATIFEISLSKPMLNNQDQNPTAKALPWNEIRSKAVKVKAF